MKKKIIIVIGILVFLVIVKLTFDASKFIPIVFQYLFNKEISLKKANSNVNLLLLGIGGGNHEGPNLTDTIIFASLDQKNNKVTLVSIPRDLWVPDMKAKINTAYAFGEEKQKGGGLILTKAVVSKTLNQPVDYAVRLDFNGFVKAVDLVGGLDITVDNALDDYQYPIEGKENDSCGRTDKEIIDLTDQISSQSAAETDAFPCRYKHLHFDKGKIHMDGKTALEFVRSRHATGEEGTDFARSKRQEKVIIAFKNKVFSVQTFLNPSKILNLYSILQESIDTDIKQDEFDDFIKLAQKMKTAKINSLVLDLGDEEKTGLLVNPYNTAEFNGQWVLVPKDGNGNFTGIQKYVSCEIKKENCSIILEPTNTIKK